jgi:hypothetical protein
MGGSDVHSFIVGYFRVCAAGFCRARRTEAEHAERMSCDRAQPGRHRGCDCEAASCEQSMDIFEASAYGASSIASTEHLAAAELKNPSASASLESISLIDGHQLKIGMKRYWGKKSPTRHGDWQI